MSKLGRELRKVLAASCRIPRVLYEEDGLIAAVLLTPMLPIAVPFAAAWWFSIDEEHREALEEWDEIAE